MLPGGLAATPEMLTASSRRSCTKKAHRKALNFNLFAEREALEPTLSKNIIKLQITDNNDSLKI